MNKLVSHIAISISLLGVTACTNHHLASQPESEFRNQQIRKTVNDFTFIHSAWMGGWQWGHVGGGLEGAGYTVSAPDLPGHGTDKTRPENITMNDYVKTMTDILDGKEEKTVLVGHSFGGVVASQVAEARPEKVEAIVYLCAFMLPNGASFLDATQGVTTSQVLNNLVFTDDGSAVGIKESALHEAVAHDVPMEAFAAAKPNLVLEPTAPLGAKLSLTDQGYGSIPKYYVECAQDNAIPLPIQRAMHGSQDVEKVYSLDTSHGAIFSKPEEVANILTDIAAREHVRNAVNTASQNWQNAFNSGDAKAAASLYEQDAVMVAKPFGTYEGRPSIQTFWEGLVKGGYSDVAYVNPKLTILDTQTAQVTSDWTMNKAKGVITNELWVIQPDGTALLREDHFEAK